MILSFQHKGLRLYYETGSVKGYAPTTLSVWLACWRLWTGRPALGIWISLAGGYTL